MLSKLFQRMDNKVERVIAKCFDVIGVQGFLLSNKKGAAILCYHGLTIEGSKKLNMRHYSVKSIEEHFKMFKKYFNVISVQDYFQRKFDDSKFNIAITFDDGYRNNLRYLFPLVEKFKLPVSIYCTGVIELGYDYLWADFVDIVSYYSEKLEIEINNVYFKKVKNKYINIEGLRLQDYIKREGDFSLKKKVFTIFDDFPNIIKENQIDEYWQLMSENEIRKISKSNLITVGSHGYFHNNLANISSNEVKWELNASKEYLEKLTQKEVKEIAYPDGSYSPEIINLAEENGFLYQLVLDYNIKLDKLDNRIENRKGMYPVYSDINQVIEINNLL